MQNAKLGQPEISGWFNFAFCIFNFALILPQLTQRSLYHRVV